MSKLFAFIKNAFAHFVSEEPMTADEAAFWARNTW